MSMKAYKLRVCKISEFPTPEHWEDIPGTFNEVEAYDKRVQLMAERKDLYVQMYKI